MKSIKERLAELHFHEHPNMARIYKLTEDHAIIDRISYDEVLALRKDAREVSEKVMNKSKSYLTLYPNKFRLITSVSEIKSPGLYYINDSIHDASFKYSLIEWISDVLVKNPDDAYGFQNASIEEYEFCKKYAYPLGRLNYKQDVCMGKREFFLSCGVNPIRIHNKPGKPDLVYITLWGSYINRVHIQDISLLTVEFAAILMSVFDVLVREGVQSCLRYIREMNNCKLGCCEEIYPNKVSIRKNSTDVPYVLDLYKKDEARRDFELLKKYLIK